MEQTDCKPYQPLSKVKHEMDLAYTSSSDESEDGRKPRQSYNSRETLHEYNQELRMNYNSQSRTRKEVEKSTQEMEFCETPHTLCSGYQTDMHSVSRHGYQLEMGSDVDTETEGAASPDHALRMWIRGMKSEHSSCLSSRANSALSLTDTDHERKSDGENGFKFSPVCCDMEAQAGSTQGKCFQIFDDKLFLPHPISDNQPAQFNPANNTQAWFINLSKISLLVACWFVFLWKISWVCVDGNSEEVREELRTKTRFKVE